MARRNHIKTKSYGDLRVGSTEIQLNPRDPAKSLAMVIWSVRRPREKVVVMDKRLAQMLTPEGSFELADDVNASIRQYAELIYGAPTDFDFKRIKDAIADYFPEMLLQAPAREMTRDEQRAEFERQGLKLKVCGKELELY